MFQIALDLYAIELQSAKPAPNREKSKRRALNSKYLTSKGKVMLVQGGLKA